jgi:tetratricopeptide (TPR) repeat protein
MRDGDWIFLPHVSAPIRAESSGTEQAVFAKVSSMVADCLLQAAKQILRQAEISISPTPNEPLAATKVSNHDPAPRVIRDNTPRLDTARPGGAARSLQEAELLLQARRPLEAVNYAHQALQLAPNDHDVLMALMDVHRRSAELLSGPEHFREAEQQLQCALRHRENDEPTRKALANRYLEQALFREKEGRFSEATELIAHALEYDDSSEIENHFRRISAETH